MKIFQFINYIQLIIISYLVLCCSCENKILTENKAKGIKPKGPFLIDAFEVPVNDSRNLERLPLKANWLILKQTVSLSAQIKQIRKKQSNILFFNFQSTIGLMLMPLVKITECI